MNPERHSSSTEIIDRVAQIDNSDLSSKVHHSRLFRYNLQAILKEVPDIDDIGLNQPWLFSVQTILQAIGAAAKISSKHRWLLPEIQYDHDVVLADSSVKFYENLRKLYDAADYNWNLLRAWYYYAERRGSPSTILSFKDHEEFKKTWEPYIGEYLSTVDWQDIGVEDFANYGLAPEVDYQPYENDVYTYIEVDNFDVFVEQWELGNDDVDLVINWFEKHLDELNYLYEHSVKLINQSAYDSYYEWLLTENTYEEQKDTQRVSWPSSHVSDGFRYFSRGFEAEIFGKEFDVFPGKTPSVKSSELVKVLTEARNMSHSIREYTYYLDYLENTGATAILSAKEVKKWQDWYKRRKEWHIAFVEMESWWFTHEDTPTSKDMEPVYAKMIELQNDVKIKIDDLEILKADEAVLAKLGPKKKPSNEAETISKMREAIDEYKPFLDEYGLEVKIQKKYDSNTATRNSLKLLEQYWLKPNRDKLALKQDDRTYGGLTDVAKTEATLRKYIGTPTYESWFEVLNEGDGKCTRHAIGYQRVEKAGAKDSAFRNAGMRFVEANNLEPVANFDEITLDKALSDQIRHQCKLKDVTESRISNIIRGFRGLDDYELLEDFRDQLVDVGYENSQIDTFLSQAIEQVGKKIITKKTQYDARQVAGLFAAEQESNTRKNKKILLPKTPLKPKAPGRVTAAIMEYGLLTSDPDQYRIKK